MCAAGCAGAAARVVVLRGSDARCGAVVRRRGQRAAVVRDSGGNDDAVSREPWSEPQL